MARPRCESKHPTKGWRCQRAAGHDAECSKKSPFKKKVTWWQEEPSLTTPEEFVEGTLEVDFRTKNRPEPSVSAWSQEERLLYAVGIDEKFFLAWNGDEWTERALYARRFSKLREAYDWAQRIGAQFPNSKVEVLRLWLGFVFERV